MSDLDRSRVDGLVSAICVAYRAMELNDVPNYDRAVDALRARLVSAEREACIRILGALAESWPPGSDARSLASLAEVMINSRATAEAMDDAGRQ